MATASAATLLVLWQLRKLFLPGLAAGWDLSAHLFLSLRFEQYLTHGRLSGFDNLWSCGYPEFALYPPLGYLPFALVRAVTNLPPEAAFHLLLIAYPLFQLLCLAYLARTFFNDDATNVAVLAGLLVCLAPFRLSGSGLGLWGMLGPGFVPGSLGVSLSLLFVTAIERSRRTGSAAHIVLSGILFGIVCLTHGMSAIFCVFAFLCHLSFCRNYVWRRFFGTFSVALAITLPWLLLFWRHLPFSQAEARGGPPGDIDPLLVLFPDLFLSNFFYVLTSDGFVAAAASLPFASYWLLAGLLVGLFRLVSQRQFFLPTLVVTSSLVIPRELWARIVDLPIHYYRFLQPASFVSAAVAATGLVAIFRRFGRGSVFLFALTLSISGFYSPDLPGSTLWRKAPPLLIEDYPGYDAATRMMEEVAQRKPTGRVLPESARRERFVIGSPHLFTALLPLRYQVPVASGLLFESSLMAPHVATIAGQCTSPGISALDVRRSEWQQIPVSTNEALLAQLQMLGIEYFLTSTPSCASKLNALTGPELSLVLEEWPFHLFRVSHFEPLVAAAPHLPYLFVDGGGRSFFEFSKMWFAEPELHPYPVILLQDDVSSLPDSTSIAGIIVSVRNGEFKLPKSIGALTERSGQVIIWGDPRLLNSKDITVQPDVVNDEQDREAPQFVSLFRSKSASARPYSAAEKRIVTDREIEFSATGPTIINLGYSPNWRSSDPRERIFLVTPARMLLFSQGITRLRYE